MAARKFEFAEGGSSKFWNIELNGSSFTVQYGRIGTTGQSQKKDFASDDAAQKAHDKLIAEKTGKGYRELGSAAASPTPSASVSPAAAKTTTVKSSAATKAPSKKKAAAAPAPTEEHPAPTTKPSSVTISDAPVKPLSGTPPPSVLKLEPLDPLWVTYEPHTPQVRSAAPPFSIEESFEKLIGMKWPTPNNPDWSSVPLTTGMTREEAHFWLTAMTSVTQRKDDKKYPTFLKKTYDGNVSVEDGRRLLHHDNMVYAPIMLPLCNLFGDDELAEILVNHGIIANMQAHAWKTAYLRRCLITGFRIHVLPFLTEAGKDEFRKRLKPLYDINNWDRSSFVPSDQSFYYAAAIGMHEETLALVQSWKNNEWLNNQRAVYTWPHMIVFGLGSRELVVAECKRTGLALSDSEQMRAWLAHTGFSELHYIVQSVTQAGNKQAATQLARELGDRALAPETAIAMVHVFLNSKAQDTARKWLEANRHYSVPGLKAAMEGSGKVAEQARRFLEAMGELQRETTATGNTPSVLAAAAPPAKKTSVPKIEGLVLPKDTERSIHLAPEDYRWITYRESQPLPIPNPAKPFDLEQELAKLEAREWISWDRERFNQDISKQEAHFWLQAVLTGNNGRKAGSYQHLHDFDKLQVPTLDDLAKKFFNSWWVSEHVMVLLRTLYDPLDILRVLLKNDGEWGHTLVEGFRLYILPYLTKTQVAAAREVLNNTEPPAKWPTMRGVKNRPPYYYLCAYFGLHEKTLQLVESWEAKAYDSTDHIYNRNWYHYAEQILFGLGSAELVEAHARRSGIRLMDPKALRGYLAHVGWNGLDIAEKAIRSVRSSEEVQRLMDVLALVKAPEAAQVMFRLLKYAPAAGSARDYLLDNPVHSAAALISISASRSKDANDAYNFLRFLKLKGHGDQILAAATAYGKEVHEYVSSHVLRDYAAEFASAPEGVLPASALHLLQQLATGLTPTWATISELPPLRLGKIVLAGRDLEPVLRALEASTIDARHPVVDLLREVAEPADRDAFAWKVAEMWLLHGGVSKDKWALAATGLIGGDHCALKLAPLIRAWPGESQHQRAVFGLDCLRCIGSDVALMQISGIAGKVKFAALKKRANECMEAIAKERQMSRAQLEDRIIPDCDLNEQGTRIFDFGARQFRMVLGAGLKPMLRYPDNSLKANLPAPNAKDDAEMAKQAADDWKVTKKVVQDAAKIQAYRLEQAMVTGRRWTPEEFRTLLVNHPLMLNLVNALVWGTYDTDGKLNGTFRVTEDRTFADSSDDEIGIADAAQIGLPHALNLTDSDKAQWGQVLGDYRLIPPFTQIGREIFALEKNEKDGNDIKRYGGLQIPAAALVFTLDKFGWQREVTNDGGSFAEHTKQFYGAGLTAYVHYEPGAAVQYIAETEDQEIKGCQFYEGLLTPSTIPYDTEALPLSKVDPVVISEVLRELKLVAEKVKTA